VYADITDDTAQPTNNIDDIQPYSENVNLFCNSMLVGEVQAREVANANAPIEPGILVF
jgi:hypothetical protein